MRTYYPLLTIFLIAFFLGCSNSSNPTLPLENSVPVPVADARDSGTAILGAGTMNLDTGELIQSKDLSGYLNVTPYIGSNFSYRIVKFYQPCYLEVEFSITNPTSLTVWDVCLMFENLYGKSIIYGDGYMDIFQPYDPDPFIMFCMDGDSYYTFPPYETIESTGLIKYPAGASPMVDYFIIAHLGGNTGGVKFVDGEIEDGVLMPDGGTATLGAVAYDYQHNVQLVVADTTPISGGLTFFSPSGEANEWTADITNSQHAPSGDYECWIMAKSPSTPQYNTYRKMTITVSHYPTTVYVDDDNVDGPWNGSSSHPFRYIQNAVDYAVDGDTIWVMPGEYHEGEQKNPYELKYLRINGLHNVTIHGDGLPKIIPTAPIGSVYDEMIAFNGCTNTVFDGFEITPAPGYKRVFGVYFGTDNQIKNCVITPSASYALEQFLGASSEGGLQIVNNTIDGVLVKQDSSFNTNLVNLAQCNGVVFSLNTIQNLVFDSIPVGNNFNYYILNASSSDNLSVIKNRIGNIDLDCSIAGSATFDIIHLLSADNNIIRNNLIHDIHFSNPSNYATIHCVELQNSPGVAIYNNTIDSILTTTSDSSDSAGIHLDNSATDLILHSNIISRILSTNSGWSYGVASPDTIYQEYSDVWSITTFRYYWNATEGYGGFDEDPEFVDYINNDYHLSIDPTSPCLGTGLNGQDMGCYGGIDPMP